MQQRPPDQQDSPVSDEAQLLRRAQQGDFAAFEALVQHLQPRVYGLARRILGQTHDAEDVTQQTFVSLIEHLEDFRGESSIATWVLKIATNHALKLLRKRRGLPTVSLDGPADPEEGYARLPHPDYIAQWREDPADLAQNHEIRRHIEQLLDALDDKYRLVFVLRDIHGLTVKETAELLGLTEANVKVRLLRARLMLREQLTRLFGDEATRVVPDHRHE
ncbi:MAG: RNA polymerase sigma factor [Pirellulaceae bacterium]|nr:MAG: RNA polymerase sigma factor [Pirellulaceae bacterium]